MPSFGEPIHSYPDYASAERLKCPGAIQSHGLLLQVATLQTPIQCVSDNAPDFLGYPPGAILGKPLSFLFSDDFLETVAQIMPIDQPYNCRTIIRGMDQGMDQIRPVTVVIHQQADGILFELEPELEQAVRSSPSLDQLDFGLRKLQGAHNLEALLNEACLQIQSLTRFERVLAYQFDTMESGMVIAEVKPEGAIAYQGLRYPATDIPKPAREMYQEGSLRFIPDLSAQPVPLKTLNGLPTEQIDLSCAVLRSVDDCCVTYHRNMGVTALLVIPLVVNRELWGLISCHHSQPHPLSFDVRAAIGIMGRYISSELHKKLSLAILERQNKLKQIQTQLIHSLSESEQFSEVLIQPELHILDLVNAEGAAICLNNGITLLGNTPKAEEVFELLRWALTKVNDFLFATHYLPALYPPAMSFKDRASGILLLSISKTQNYHILWFRPEVKQLVNWAGNPEDPFLQDADGQLGPRQSFAQWQDMIQHQSYPWLISEQENALGLRSAISGIALKKADQLAHINQELERSNEELASFAYAASHDLKEPLRGIYNYTTFLLEDYADVLDDAGVERMQSLVRLTRRMDQLIDALLRFSQMRQVSLSLQSIDLNKLVASVWEMIHVSRPTEQIDVRIPRKLPTIEGDPVLLNELFTNLFSNALKYNDSQQKWVEIGFLTAAEYQNRVSSPKLRPGVQAKMVFFIKDNGIGIRTRHLKTIFRLFKRLHARNRYGGGTGAGLTIVKKIVERHGGSIWVESQLGKGTTFWLTLT